MKQTLPREDRRKLETLIAQAREIAEAGALRALHAGSVAAKEAPGHASEAQKKLRVRLRAHGRQLGDSLRPDDTQTIDHLVNEIAYEHWHRMLFARFLAENDLLMHPDGYPVSLQDCKEDAATLSPPARSEWEVAGRYASAMLPNVFRPDSPALALELPLETEQALEALLQKLPASVFAADDSLGWSYQFWQAPKKEAVQRQMKNAGSKVGADELPAVTQLFTEQYMVAFLLENALGGWWLGRHAEKPLPVAMPYLRIIEAFVEAPSRRLTDTEVEAASSRLDKTRQDAASTTRLEGASTLGYFDPHEPLAVLSGNLPHWRQEGVSYFVTFRSADSLPQEKLAQWKNEREQWLKDHPEPRSEADKREYYRLFPERIDYWLDQGYGELPLADPECKRIVEDALAYFDGERYQLIESVVMPNHVHALLSPLGKHSLSEILHSWKSFTSNAINRVRGREGTFWEKESFDMIIRSAAHAERVRQYIRDNPKKVEAASSRLFDTRQDAVSTINTRLEGASTVDAPSRRVLIESLEDNKHLEGASTPAAGTFPGWPKSLADFKLLDPCCGSGHFLVAALHYLVPLRVAGEGLTVRDAINSVLADNLHGLELDARCVEIAAFALALAAWRYPDENGEPLGYRPLPRLNIACCGVAPQSKKADWLKLANGEQHLEEGMAALYALYQKAPELGSLLEPHAFLPSPSGRGAGGEGDLFAAGWEEVAALLEQALAGSEDENAVEARVAAQGMAQAIRILTGRYHLVVTNPPYLGAGQHGPILKDFCETHYKTAKGDLANVFLERSLKLCKPGGVVQFVMPQNWLFLGSYKKQRERLLKQETWNLLARLGSGAFETITGEVVNAILLTLSKGVEAPSRRLLDMPVEAASSRLLDTRLEGASTLRGIDASGSRTPEGKAELLNVEAASSRLLDTRLEGASTLRGIDASVPRTPEGKAELLNVEAASSRLHDTRLEGASTLRGIDASVPRTPEGKEELLNVEAASSRLLDTRLEGASTLRGIDASGPRTPEGKAELLRTGGVVELSQAGQLENPDARVSFDEHSTDSLLKSYVSLYEGSSRGDMERFDRYYWELQKIDNRVWSPLLNSPIESAHFSGREVVIEWREGEGVLAQSDAARIRGKKAWGRKGVFVARTRDLKATLSLGEVHAQNGVALIPKKVSHLSALWVFCSSERFQESVRSLNGKIIIPSGVLYSVPFDLAHWQQVAAERYPDGLPQPYSDDPTQWIFHGHPKPSTDPLQVAVARLLGYRWPAEVEAASSRLSEARQDVASTPRLEVASTARAWIARCNELADLSDDDGIVCLPPVRGEPTAADRLRALLARAFGDDWSAAREAQLLKDAGCDGMTLNLWLRDRFFEQHVARFHKRPFIWHVWDGHKEGFSALLNYHALTREKLQTLIHTYLGDWITQQRRAIDAGNADASLKLAKAEALKTKLEAILEGEPPYDIFVRWKPLAEQPMGWEPDLNDGVRLNIRPFVEAEVLRIPRAKLGIKWEADRGKDVPSAPWYALGPQYGEPEGTRINHHHTSLAEKRVAAASSRLSNTRLEGASTLDEPTAFPPATVSAAKKGSVAASMALLQSPEFRKLPKADAAEVEQRIQSLRNDWGDDS